VAVVGVRAEVVEEDAHPGQVLGVEGQMRLHERADPLERAALDPVDLLDVRERILVDAVEDLVEQVLLGADVVVEAALEDPDGLCDVLDRTRLVALLVEDARGSLEHLLVPAARRSGRRAVLNRHTYPSPLAPGFPRTWTIVPLRHSHAGRI
jgi:hypothetical protein